MSLMRIFEMALLMGLIICAISVTLTKRMITAVVVFMSYSMIMSVIWVILQSPDLAITEAAVGAGVTSILFFVTLKKINAFNDEPVQADGAGTASSEEEDAAYVEDETV